MAGVWQLLLQCCAIVRLVKTIGDGGGKYIIYRLLFVVFVTALVAAPLRFSFTGLKQCDQVCFDNFQITFYKRALAEEIIPQANPVDVGAAPSKDNEASDIDIEGDQSLFAPIEALFFKGEVVGHQGETDRGPPVAEVFTGVDFTQNQIGLYAGGVTGALGAHLGPDLPMEGLKLRAVYGRGYYKYVSSKMVGGASVDVEFQGTSEFYEAMVGYEFRFMGSIYKAYGGVISETNHIDPRDVNNSLEGTNVGAKLLLEGWHEFSDGGWLSGYGSYSTGSEYYVVHGRYGRVLNSQLSVGLEAGVFGNKEFDALRFGGFSRYKIGKAEITMSAGVSGDYDQPDAVYGTMQYFTKIHSLRDLMP